MQCSPGDLMRRESACFIRWESDFDRVGSSSWWHVVKDNGIALEDLSASTRSKVRRGMKNFSCKPVSAATVADEGYSVYEDAYSRYETYEPLFSKEKFRDAIAAMPLNTEFWVAEDHKGAMMAFSENFIDGDSCFFNTIWFRPSALQKYVSYALFFEMHRHYLGERGFRYVSDGARSISHDTQIHDFLISKFGYRRAYARLHVLYAPWLAMAVKVAFPFRRLIGVIPIGMFRKASILLEQEAIRRKCAKRA